MRRPRRPTDRPLGGIAAIGAVGLAVVGGGSSTAGVILILLALVGAVATAVGPQPRGGDEPGDIVVDRGASSDDQALAVAQQRLAAQLADPARVDSAVRPQLVTLVSERLARRGTSLGAPGARELLGEPLWTFLTGPARTRPLARREFDALLTRVETL